MVPIVSLLLHRRHTSSSMQRALMGVDYMPYGSNCIIHFGEWCLEFLVHNFTCSHIPGQRGGSNFFGQMFSPIELLSFRRGAPISNA